MAQIRRTSGLEIDWGFLREDCTHVFEAALGGSERERGDHEGQAKADKQALGSDWVEGAVDGSERSWRGKTERTSKSAGETSNDPENSFGSGRSRARSHTSARVAHFYIRALHCAAPNNGIRIVFRASGLRGGIALLPRPENVQKSLSLHSLAIPPTSPAIPDTSLVTSDPRKPRASTR